MEKTPSEIVTDAFCKSFEVVADEAVGLVYEGIEEWDSIGHMMMVSELETSIGKSIELDDIISISDFQTCVAVIEKYLP